MRPLHFPPLLLGLLLALALLKVVVVSRLGWHGVGAAAFVAAALGGGWALGRRARVSVGKRSVAVALLFLPVLVAVGLTPWPYEVEAAGRAVDLPPGGELVHAHRSGSMICFDQCSTATFEWRYPPGVDVNATTRALAASLRDDGWRIEVERLPGPNDPGTAWIDHGWVQAHRPGLDLTATVHPCADDPTLTGVGRCEDAAGRPASLQVTVVGR